MKKNIVRTAKVLALVYSIVGIIAYYRQEQLIFHPLAVSRQTRYGLGQPFTELNIPYDAASNINIVQFKPIHPIDSLSRGVILYFHGNAEYIGNSAAYANTFTSQGYEWWVVDYPGFGKSTGPLTEQRLYDYALVLYRLARTRFQPNQIIVYGRSIGTGVAAQLASVRDCRRLILESPYYSLTSVARHYLPVYPVGTMLHYHFPTNEYLASVTAPITIFHGDNDGLIPYSNASRLLPLLKPGDEFITIAGGGHNDLGNFTQYRSKLDSILLIGQSAAAAVPGAGKE